MARLSRTFLVLSLLAAAACGGDGDSSPPSSPPPSGSGDTVTGRERFGWTQAASASDAGVLQFAAYVDGTRRVLEGVACSGGSSGTLECSAPLPAMSPGSHMLELAAFYQSGDSVIEGPRTPALQLRVAGITPSAESASGKHVPVPEDGPVAASDGTMLDAGILGTDLLNPVDVAVDPSGRVFVAERAGTIRIFDQDGAFSSGDSVDNLASSHDEGSALLSIALAPDFFQFRSSRLGRFR